MKSLNNSNYCSLKPFAKLSSPLGKFLVSKKYRFSVHNMITSNLGWRQKQLNIDFYKQHLYRVAIVSLISFSLLTPISCFALDKTSGESIFLQHCSGCHVNGGNIIRRGKNLKIKALKRNGLDNPEAIAQIARNGIGSMSGYSNVLAEGEDQIVADWVWEQAQKAWVQG